MKNIKVLYNQNKLCNEITKDAYYSDQCEEFSIRLVFNGCEDYTIGQRSYSIYPGSFIIINEGTSYSKKIYTEVPVNSFAVYFSSTFLNDFHYGNFNADHYLLDNPFNAGLPGPPKFLETIYPFRGDMLFNMRHLNDHFQNWSADELLIDDYVYHCLFLFYKLYNQEIIAKSQELKMQNYKTRAEIFKRLSMAKDYILSNYNKPICMEDISQYCCLSLTHLYRTFKQAYHCSPHQFVIKTRLENARHLLKTTNYGVNEIVGFVGLDCPSTFIKLFKSTFSVTPGVYRSDNQRRTGAISSFN